MLQTTQRCSTGEQSSTHCTFCKEIRGEDGGGRTCPLSLFGYGDVCGSALVKAAAAKWVHPPELPTACVSLEVTKGLGLSPPGDWCCLRRRRAGTDAGREPGHVAVRMDDNEADEPGDPVNADYLYYGLSRSRRCSKQVAAASEAWFLALLGLRATSLPPHPSNGFQPYI